MAQKLWEKNIQVNAEIDRFTVGRDREMDLYLAKYDVLGSMAHITMLESIGLLRADELDILLKELRKIYESAEQGHFAIEEGIEDVHSQVELMLTRRLGDVGKKIHSGRSRNDQVLVDLTTERNCGSGRGPVPCADCPKQPIQECPDARIYTSADCHAFFFRTMVRCLCGKSGRRHDVLAGGL